MESIFAVLSLSLFLSMHSRFFHIKQLQPYPFPIHRFSFALMKVEHFLLQMLITIIWHGRAVFSVRDSIQNCYSIKFPYKVIYHAPSIIFLLSSSILPSHFFIQKWKPWTLAVFLETRIEMVLVFQFTYTHTSFM